jgi:hypothetical protein
LSSEPREILADVARKHRDTPMDVGGEDPIP